MPNTRINNTIKKAVFTLSLLLSCSYGFAQSYVLHSDVVYNDIEGVDQNMQSLDIYTPNAPTLQNLPVIIYVHGGAWRAGDKVQPKASHYKYFTEQGYIFVSVNYRLSPTPKNENWLKPNRIKSPLHSFDIAKAVAWTIDNIKDYGGNPDQIAIMGHSAGAHLALLVSTNEQLLLLNGKSTSDIKCACSLDIAAMNVPLLMQSSPQPVVDTLVNALGDTPELLIEASPALQVTKDDVLPEFLLLHRNQDFVEDQNLLMLKALQENGHTAEKVKLDLKHVEINNLLGIDKAQFDLQTATKPASPNAYAISQEYSNTVSEFLRECLAREK